MILAGDIGGTKTNLALFDAQGASQRTQASYRSAKYDSLEAIIAEFVGEQSQEKITAACFGIAGPVVGDQVKASNLAWTVERATLVRALDTSRVLLINDLEATAYGIEALSSHQCFTLSEGTSINHHEGDSAGVGHRALIAAGTGLGMAGIFFDGARFHPMPSEGGHIEFAPRDETQIALLQYLQRKFSGRASYERVLSGSGLVNIYEFLRDTSRAEESAQLAREIEEASDIAATIGAAALAGKSELAMRALEMFVEIYGAAAGNLALLLKPVGGLYVGGGIAPKILDALKGGAFMRAFADKGRMSALAASFPVRVILDDKTALYGAARCAQLHG
jgi:glucokinase